MEIILSLLSKVKKNEKLQKNWWRIKTKNMVRRHTSSWVTCNTFYATKLKSEDNLVRDKKNTSQNG
jgi:hypothetical protein